jgi:polyferredoxin
MRAIATVILMLLSFSIINTTVRAEQSNDCKQCREQQRACTKNYSAKVCKTEYDICLKSCQRK